MFCRFLKAQGAMMTASVRCTALPSVEINEHVEQTLENMAEVRGTLLGLPPISHCVVSCPSQLPNVSNEIVIMFYRDLTKSHS